MRWFGYITIWTLSLAATALALVTDPWLRTLWLAGFCLGYLALLAFGAWFPQFGFYCESVNRGPADLGAVALTFDDGPDAKVTPKLLDLLKAERVPAAFFVVGCAVEANPTLLRRAEAEGHLIANHTYTHGSWWVFLGRRRLREELSRTGRAVAQVIQRTPRFLRLPFGVGRPGLGRLLRESGLINVAWDIRDLEGARREPENIAAHIARRARNGSIILLHERRFRTRDSGPAVVETARRTITRLRARGFTFARLDHLLEQAGYVEDSERL